MGKQESRIFGCWMKTAALLWLGAGGEAVRCTSIVFEIKQL
jgi:hypothetical protein